ncbi:cache domain-containing protein [Vibrio mediterranei]|uniref:cache domain-containing protein n=1 Tax=Vibrio mediterranei TaxID=689 RepID=UPI0017F533DB|nr:cache domain-containing protein [Vibrio mediterranei]
MLRDKLTEQVNKAIVIRIRCNYIYKDSEYVYIADEDMTFIVVPLDPVLLRYGTSFHNFKDSVGQSITDIILSELDSDVRNIARVLGVIVILMSRSIYLH